MAISRLNHAVLYVRDVRRTGDFYRDVLGFQDVVADPSGRFLFLRAPGGDDPRGVNHHDIAFFAIGERAHDSQAGRATVGLYHLAWEVESIGELAEMRRRLSDAGALVGASDHGVSKSLYARDPDGIEFEIMWRVPAHLWGDMEHEAIIEPLNLDAEIAKYSEIV